jgi:membrane fusion protein
VTHHRPLFRQQALDFQRDRRQWGGVALVQPLSTRIAAWGLVGSVALLIAFLFVAPYARKETVSGFLMPGAGTARIHLPQPGTISQVHVAEGQLIKAGEPLITVTTPQVTAEGTDVGAAILHSLTRQRDLLASQIEMEGQRTTAERDRLSALVDGLATEISHLQAQAATQRDRIRLAEGMVASGASLTPRGYVSELELRRREEALLEQRQNLDLLGQHLAARRNQLVEMRSALDQLPMAEADRLRTLRGELSVVEQRIAETSGRRAYVVRAPTDGRVSALQATVGQPADPRRLQLSIVPEDGTLQAELFVPTRAVGFVHTGQEVRILYDAFSYQHFGTHRGRIVRVSQTILTPGDAIGPVALAEPAYRVTATLERQTVDAQGEAMPLQPDMLLRADIILDRRPIMEWIMGPLLGAGARGMHR